MDSPTIVQRQVINNTIIVMSTCMSLVHKGFISLCMCLYKIPPPPQHSHTLYPPNLSHNHCHRSAIDSMAKDHSDHIRRMGQAAAQATQTEETHKLEQLLAEKEEELANALRDLEEAQEAQDRLVSIHRCVSAVLSFSVHLLAVSLCDCFLVNCPKLPLESVAKV